MQPLLYIVLPLCLAISFLCSGMEAGLFTLGRWRIVQQMRAGQARATRLYRYLRHTENFLWTVLVGNTITVFVALWIVALALDKQVNGRASLFWPAFVGVTFVFYIFCDLLPKNLFRKYPNRLCLLASAPFRWLHALLTPLVSIIEEIAQLLLRWTGGTTYKGQAFSNRNELRLLMEDDTGSESLSSEERAMVHRVFDLHSVAARQIAIPFARSPMLSANQTVADALARFREAPQNVLAVASESTGVRRIAGFIEAKRLIFADSIAPDEPLRRHLTPALYLSEDIRLHEALRRMQRRGQRMAVVLARDQREIGLITLEEILKFVFGEVRL